MSPLRWQHRPELRRPVLLTAFEGWNDAGESATTAVRYLARALDAGRFATIDAEEFYDFTVARPQVHLDADAGGGDEPVRRLEWPEPVFQAGRTPSGRDLIFLTGIEPALKWRSFTALVVEACRDLQVELVLTLGALLADVPHTRPVQVRGTSGDAAVMAEHGFSRSRYEGPTGILGVLAEGCRAAGIPSASLWATTPHYLRETASPKAALALVERVGRMFDFSLETTDLEIATAAYERQVDDMLAGEEDVADYVRGLEEAVVDGDEEIELPSQDALAAEVERFLRDQRGSPGD
ncbi:MAG: PAC2 family protein [Actinobacteria bacterium]|nr:PAC2 family protein [Actinomycetota bacterium]MBW3650984.1 PAC2 family protein [Actinomycetota bacterium]